MRRLLFVLVFMIAAMPCLSSCSDQLAKRLFMYGFEKAIGANPEPIKLDSVDLSLTVELKVAIANFMLTKDRNKLVPARPLTVVMTVWRQNKDKVLDKKVIEKVTSKEGTVSFVATFSRVYMDDSIVYTLEDPRGGSGGSWLWSWDNKDGWIMKKETIINYLDIKNARFVEKEKCYYLTIKDERFIPEDR